MDCSLPGSLSMGFSRQEYWSGLLYPSPGNHPIPGIEPRSPELQADSSPTELRGKPKVSYSFLPQSECEYPKSRKDIPISPVRSVHFSSVSRSVMSDSLRPHELQQARPPCPSPTPRVHPNSCPLSRWCHPAISSSVVPFSSCPQFLPASGSFPMSQFFASGGQSIGVSASTSVLPMNTQDWSPLWWDCLDLFAVQGIFKSLLQHHSSKASIFRHSAFFIVQLSHPFYWKNHSFD